MKVRSDFVTNSSSSSFVSISINNPMLSKIMKKYEDFFLYKDDSGTKMVISDDSVEIQIEEGYCDEPTTLDELLCSLLCALGLEIYDEDNIDDYSIGEDETLVEFAKELLGNKKDILDATTHVEFTVGECGWQGDSDARYCFSNYDEETLNDIYNTIAAEKNCTPDEVTEDDFNEYVSDKISTDERAYYYDKETNEESHTQNFYIE